MNSPRPSFTPPSTSLPSVQHYQPSGEATPPQARYQPQPPDQPPWIPAGPTAAVPFVDRAARARRHRRLLIAAVAAAVVVAVAVAVVTVAATLSAVADLGRETADQPSYAAPVLPGTVPLDPGNDCEPDFNADVATAMAELGISYDGVGCPNDTDVIISLQSRYPRARLISVAEQLLTQLYDAGWDVERVEVYDAAGTGGFYTW